MNSINGSEIRKISIVTPCFNSEKYIVETFESVIFQHAVLSGRVQLEYIICDGKSNDKTLDIIKSYNNPSVKIISGQDNGMYDALHKGLSIASGELCAYLNAGDYYSKYAFDIVLDLFENKEIYWLTGFNTYYNEASYLVNFKLPFKYRSHFFHCGFYGSILPFVQQESTFWKKELMSLVDFKILKNLKLAGDSYLWNCFSKKHQLYIVEAYIGGFKYHRGQLSEKLGLLKDELASFTFRPKWHYYIKAYFDKIVWFSLPSIKKRFNKTSLFRFNHTIQKWE